MGQTITVTDANDSLVGGGGGDTIFGGSADDVFRGDAGTDVLYPRATPPGSVMRQAGATTRLIAAPKRYPA